MPLAALGVFILWLGWFGFNPGSTTAAGKDIAMIFVNTNLAAAAGAVVAMFVSWFKFGKPEVGLRVSPEEELEGLDFVEHGGSAYPDFVEVSSYGGMSSDGPGGEVPWKGSRSVLWVPRSLYRLHSSCSGCLDWRLKAVSLQSLTHACFSTAVPQPECLQPIFLSSY